MRKYYLENESGIRFAFLNPDDGIVTNSIIGHGFGFDGDYTRVGDMFVTNRRENKQGEMKFTLNFFGDEKLKKYAKFCDYLNTSDELYLIYIPYDDVTYKRDVEVASVDDGGLSNGIFKANLTLKCKSLFYSIDSSEFVVSADEAGMTFDFVWDTFFNDYSSVVADITNNGHTDSAFQVEFAGYVVKPKIEVFQGSDVIHSVVFPVTIMQGETLQYSTLDDDLYIRLIKKDGSTQNLIGFLSIESENFFKLPKGDTQVVFTSEGGSLDDVRIKLFKYYKAV